MVIKIKYLFLVLILLSANHLFAGIITTLMQSDNVINILLKVVVITSFVITLYSIFSLEHDIKVFWVIILLYLFSLILESLFKYGSIMEFPHVFNKIFIMFVPLATYYLYKERKISLNAICNLILIIYLFDLIILGWIRYFSPFSFEFVPTYIGNAGDSRVFHAKIIFLLIIPLLHKYNLYLLYNRKKDILIFLFVVAVIIIQNHRSVWIAAIFALIINYLFVIKNYALNRGKKIFPILSTICSFSIILLILSISFQSIGIHINNRLEDILYFQTQGTGQWRLEQITYYLPYIYKNVLFGLRLEGYGFTSLASTNMGFEIDSGQHFHNGYLDVLFYHGLVGLAITYGFLFYCLRKANKEAKTEIELVTLRSFLFSAFIFSLSYIPPIEIWGFLGICLAINSNTQNNTK